MKRYYEDECINSFNIYLYMINNVRIKYLELCLVGCSFFFFELYILGLLVNGNIIYIINYFYYWKISLRNSLNEVENSLY